MLLDHDESMTAMLLERLGPNLDELGASVTEMMAAIASTLASFWQPVGDDCDLPTGAWQAQWLAQLITRTWTDLGQPCDRRVVDRALAYCDERAAAFDPHTSVLVHGDAHGWNTLAAGSDTYKFVDPEGLRSERAHDLAVPMREYNEPLLAGDTPRLVARARRAARLVGRESTSSPCGSGVSSSVSRPDWSTSATSAPTAAAKRSWRSPNGVSEQGLPVLCQNV